MFSDQPHIALQHNLYFAGVITFDESHLIVSCDAGAAHAFGYDKNEVIGHPLNLLIPSPFIWQTSSQNDEVTVCLTGKLKHGDLCTVQLTVNQVSYGLQKLYIASVATLHASDRGTLHLPPDFVMVDINKSKAIEQELIQYREHFNEMLAKATNDLQAIVNRNNNIASHLPGIIYVYKLRPDGTSCFPYASDAIDDIFNIPPESIVEDASRAMALIYPEDIEAVNNSVMISARDLTPWQHEFRVVFPDATLHWLYGDSTPERAEDGSTIWYGFITDITERKSLEQELRESLNFNKTLFQKSHIPMVVHDPFGNGFVDCNLAAVNIYGFSRREDVLGKTPLDVSALTQYDGTLSADLIAKQDQTAMLNEINIFEWRHQRPNGEIWDAQVHLMRFLYHGKEMLQFTLEDITERKLAETALRASEEKLRGLFELSPLGITLTDMQGRYLEFNDAFLDICGYSESELKQLTYWDMIPDSSGTDETRQLDALISNQRYASYEKDYRHKDGRLVPINLNGMIVTAADNQQYTWSIIEDVTEKKRIAAALQQAIDELNNLIAHIPVGVYKHRIKADGSRQFEFVSPRLCELLELPEKDVYQEQDIILKQIHPHEIANFVSQVNKGQYSNAPFFWEGRLRDGMKVRWLHIEAYRTLLENGDILLTGIAYDISQSKEHEQQLNTLANYDCLTGMANRKLLMDRLQQAISQARRNHTSIAVIFLDLDGFKQVNDTYGHDAGDKLLIEIARRLTSNVREGDTVARLGGDEFVLLLLGLEQMDQYQLALQRILDSINEPINLGENIANVSASIGLSQYPTDADEPDTLLRLADQSMYYAKQSGKNRFKFYSYRNPTNQHVYGN